MRACHQVDPSGSRRYHQSSLVAVRPRAEQPIPYTRLALARTGLHARRGFPPLAHIVVVAVAIFPIAPAVLLQQQWVRIGRERDRTAGQSPYTSALSGRKAVDHLPVCLSRNSSIAVVN